MEDLKITQDEKNTYISAAEMLKYIEPKKQLFEDKLVWAIGGGKGGVGKSFFSANLAISLAATGAKVVAIDLDLGGANLHTCLGENIPEFTLTDYFTKKIVDINDIVLDTKFPNLRFISGAQDEIGIANLKSKSKNHLINSFKDIDADYLILDLGAGTSFNTIDFFIAADAGLMVTLPEPTSIENTYRFIRSCFFRRLEMFDDSFEITKVLSQATKAKINEQDSSPQKVLSLIEKSNPTKAQEIKKVFKDLNLNLIINQTRGNQEEELGFAIEKICQKYFGFHVNFLGHIGYDAAVWQSIRQKKPLIEAFPNSEGAGQLKKITKKLLNKKENHYE